MKPRMVLTFLLCLTVFAPPLIAQQTSSTAAQKSAASPQQPAQTSPSAAAASPIPSYPDSPAGLEKLITDMLKMQKGGDSKDLAVYVQSLILPNPAAWFTAAFGDKLGKEMADAYDRTRLNLPLSFPDTLGQIQSKHLTKVRAALFTDSCDQEASNAEYSVLISRTKEQPLYHVRLSSNTQSGILGFFAYVNDAFRYLGSFQIPAPPILRVGGNVMTAKAVNTPSPPYPEYAREQHVSGTVVLHAVVGTDGRVCSLQVVSGPPELVGASLNAVRQWRYKPTTLNGQPVAIDTTISVVFALGQ